METVGLTVTQEGASPFLNFLRGMETDLDLVSTLVALRLPKLP